MVNGLCAIAGARARVHGGIVQGRHGEQSGDSGVILFWTKKRGYTPSRSGEGHIPLLEIRIFRYVSFSLRKRGYTCLGVDQSNGRCQVWPVAVVKDGYRPGHAVCNPSLPA